MKDGLESSHFQKGTVKVKKSSPLLALVFFLIATIAQGAQPPKENAKFPDLDEQLKNAHAKSGSALEKLIKANQDFSKLKERDKSDSIVPPWLKVYWRKGHPEANYDNDNDPTGGYPLVLKEILEWLMTHQDLKPGNPEATMAPGTSFGDHDDDGDRLSAKSLRASANAATAGTNVRESGAQTVSRSESDIRINY